MAKKEARKDPGAPKVLKTIRDGFAQLTERLTLVEREVAKTKNLVMDVQDEVGAINTALENDARRYFDHEQRIKRLERAR